MNDLRSIFGFQLDSRYGGELFRNRYNWKFSTEGASTSAIGLRLTVWQLQIVVI